VLTAVGVLSNIDEKQITAERITTAIIIWTTSFVLIKIKRWAVI
jgi:hypothetical protein